MSNEDDSRHKTHSSSPANRTSRTNKARRLPRIMKFFLTILLIFILAGVSYAGYLYVKFDNMLGTMSSTFGVEDMTSTKASKDSKVILLLGLDTRDATRSLNTDVIMVAVFNPNSQSVSLLSVPRDLYMKPSGYKARKANAFYSIAQRQDKVPSNQLVKELFGDYLDLPIDYVTVVTFRTFENMIDELGGIEVDVDMDMCYIDNADGTNIQLSKGIQKLDGKHALDFVRYRHSTNKCKVRTAESSDVMRNERQQIILKAMVDKMTSINGILKLGHVFDAVGNNMTIDAPKDQLRSLILTYATMNKDDITFIPLEGVWKSPYIRVDEAQLNKAKQQLKLARSGDSARGSGTP